jgi:hypothetical protein
VESKEKGEPEGLNFDNAIASQNKQLRDETIYGYKKLLLDKTKSLNKLLEKAARYGSRSSAPLEVQNEVEDLENEIADLEEKLAALEQSE